MKITFLFYIFIFLLISKSFASNLIDKGYYVIDLKNKIEWLKCSAGQQWSDDKKQCLGEPIKLDLKEAKEANEILNQQLEGNWETPDKKRIRKYNL